jgi:hypothetical protein
MKLTVLAVAALLACAAPAQISGSINRGAPVVTNAIALGSNKIELSYTSIRFGEGHWQQILENADRHESFNAAAEKKPLGTVKTSIAVTAAGKQIPAGEYAMYFTAFSRESQSGWILNLKPAQGDPIRWRLMLKPSAEKHDCMSINLAPTSENGACKLTIAFGDQSVVVPVKVADAAAPASAEPKKG